MSAKDLAAQQLQEDADANHRLAEQAQAERERLHAHEQQRREQPAPQANPAQELTLDDELTQKCLERDDDSQMVAFRAMVQAYREHLARIDANHAQWLRLPMTGLPADWVASNAARVKAEYQELRKGNLAATAELQDRMDAHVRSCVAATKQELEDQRAAAALDRDRAAKLAATRKARRAREVAVSQEQIDRPAAVGAAPAARCGEAPKINAWDGELVGLEAMLKQTAHDPGSIDVEDCTPPELNEKYCWLSVCKVRGRNAFGALVLNHTLFGYAHGEFTQLD
jgi:hypothetical protein